MPRSPWRWHATSRGAVATLLILAAACGGHGPGSVAPGSLPAPRRTAACYTLDYHAHALAVELPALIALDEGHGSGRAYWFPGPHGDTTWRAFYARGHWDRSGRGHVTAVFDAEQVHVTLELEQGDAGFVTGRALRREPGADGKEAERSAALDGRHVSCPRAPGH